MCPSQGGMPWQIVLFASMLCDETGVLRFKRTLHLLCLKATMFVAFQE